MDEKKLEEICKAIGGDVKLRQFEHENSPIRLYINMIELGVPKDLAKKFSKSYKDNLYDHVINGYVRYRGIIDDKN